MMPNSDLVARPFRDRAAWRRWLERHHQSATELWVIFYKKHTGRKWISYEEALEEALCFGWIDGVIKRRDDETFMQRFSPRRRRSTWSEPNLLRARRLIDAGTMTPAGLAALGDALEAYEQRGECHRPPRVDRAPEPLLALLRSDAKAWEAFQRLAPSLRRQYLGWITQAKKQDTQMRRINELVHTLAQGKKLGLK